MSENELSPYEQGELLAEKFAKTLKKQQHKAAQQRKQDQHRAIQQRNQDQQGYIVLIALVSLLSVIATVIIKDYLDKREQQTYPEPVSEMAGYHHGY